MACPRRRCSNVQVKFKHAPKCARMVHGLHGKQHSEKDGFGSWSKNLSNLLQKTMGDGWGRWLLLLQKGSCAARLHLLLHARMRSSCASSDAMRSINHPHARPPWPVGQHGNGQEQSNKEMRNAMQPVSSVVAGCVAGHAPHGHPKPFVHMHHAFAMGPGKVPFNPLTWQSMQQGAGGWDCNLPQCCMIMMSNVACEGTACAMKVRSVDERNHRSSLIRPQVI